MDRLKGLMGRNKSERQAAPEEPKVETVLINGTFARNNEADSERKAQVINREALSEGAHGPYTLVDPDEQVVEFTGNVTQLIEFIRQAQKNPVKELAKAPPVKEPISGAELARTGVEMVVPYRKIGSFQTSYNRPKDPEGEPVRVEIVGAQLSNGQLELYYLLPRTETVHIPPSKEIRAAHRNLPHQARQEVDAVLDQKVDRTPFEFFLNNQAGEGKYRDMLDRGSIVSGYHVDRLTPSRRPGDYIVLEERRPDMAQRISPDNNVGGIRIEASDGAVQGRLKELIVPAKTARNLRIPAPTPSK